ncbi:MAG: ADP-forming succinate--CoA ligase subunit beta [Chloroflexota bacterium]
MKVHEYQAKELLKQYGVAVPEGRVATEAAEAEKTAAEIGCPVAVKAQIHAGGRGKAGGIKTADTPAEAAEAARALLGSRLVTHQTGPEGLPVDAVLVEKALAAERELYVSVLLDTTQARPLLIASQAGGMDIEELAATAPEKILRQVIDPVTGLLPFQGRNLGYGMDLSHEQVRAAGKLFSGIYRLFMEKDCSLVEINPLVVTGEGALLALDAKVNFDDNGLQRHPEIAELRDSTQEDPLEVRATDLGVNYIKLDGSIGCMVNGAGLAMATMDLVKWAGGEPANFLDVGGGASEDQVTEALKVLLSDPKVKAAWVNIFGGILRCDLVARAIVCALREEGLRVPFIVRMNGTNLDEGMQILSESGLNIVFESDLAGAARRAVAAVGPAGDRT